MKQTSFGWLVPVLTVMVPLLGLAGWELLQRHRFTAEADRLQAALQRFADSATYPGEDGKPLPTASGRTSLPYFKVVAGGREDWRERERTWRVVAVFVNPQGQWLRHRAELSLRQERKFLMGGPALVVRYANSGDWTSRPFLDQTLRDFDSLTLPESP